MLARERGDVSADLSQGALDALETRVEAVVHRVEGDGHALAEEFRRAHAGAEVDVTVLSITEACADRMRAMEGI